MFMLNRKKIVAAIVIHMMLMGISVWVFKPNIISVEPVRTLRVRFTICVRGSVVNAIACAV